VIILDEHLTNVRLIAGFRLYRGAVRGVEDLAGFVGASDELMPALLRRGRDFTFVTNNAKDFWERMDGEPTCCIVALTVSSGHLQQIPTLVRRLLRTPPFGSKAGRRGRVFHITVGSDTRGPATRWPAEAHYYIRRSDPASRGAVVLPEL
jgi:hypothetical protein